MALKLIVSIAQQTRERTNIIMILLTRSKRVLREIIKLKSNFTLERLHDVATRLVLSCSSQYADLHSRFFITANLGENSLIFYNKNKKLRPLQLLRFPTSAAIRRARVACFLTFKRTQP